MSELEPLSRTTGEGDLLPSPRHSGKICARKTGALGKAISTHQRTINIIFAAPGANRPCALAAYIGIIC